MRIVSKGTVGSLAPPQQATRPAPLWIGDPRVNIERYGERERLLDQPLVYGTWERQRAAVRELRFQAWLPGVTDKDDPELWKKIDAKIFFRFEGEQGFRPVPSAFLRRSGNNATYAMRLEQFDPWFARYHSESKVKGTNPKLRKAQGELQIARLECYFSLNGKQFRPAPGKHFQIDYEGQGPVQT